MRMLYIGPSPPPKIQGTDGLFAEIGNLQKFFGGDLISLSPARSLPPLVPVCLYGMHKLPFLKRHEPGIDIYHLFFPYLVNFPVLRFLSRPIVYTIISGIDAKCLPSSAPVCTLVVSSPQEADLLQSKGFSDVHVIRPGINISQIRALPAKRPDPEFVLLAGSAPWTKGQFETKGFELLLKAMTLLPQLRLICLWRGTLYNELMERVKSFGLVDRVEVVQEKADISEILSRCHAAVVLSSSPDLVKSYPNSLMEALAAGRPVFVSRTNPMSYYIDDNRCGKVIEVLRLEELISAIIEVRDEYFFYAKAALLAGRDLSADKMIDDYRRLYQSLMKQG